MTWTGSSGRIAGVAVALLVLVAGALMAGVGQGETSGGSKVNVIKGTPHNDRLKGTEGRDLILGRGGRDFIVGYGGFDTLRGGTGNDRIRARDHQDRIDCGPGNDDIAIIGRAEDGVYNCERLRPPPSDK